MKKMKNFKQCIDMGLYRKRRMTLLKRISRARIKYHAECKIVCERVVTLKAKKNDPDILRGKELLAIKKQLEFFDEAAMDFSATAHHKACLCVADRNEYVRMKTSVNMDLRATQKLFWAVYHYHNQEQIARTLGLQPAPPLSGADLECFAEPENKNMGVVLGESCIWGEDANGFSNSDGATQKEWREWRHAYFTAQENGDEATMKSLRRPGRK